MSGEERYQDAWIRRKLWKRLDIWAQLPSYLRFFFRFDIFCTVNTFQCHLSSLVRSGLAELRSPDLIVPQFEIQPSLGRVYGNTSDVMSVQCEGTTFILNHQSIHINGIDLIGFVNFSIGAGHDEATIRLIRGNTPCS